VLDEKTIAEIAMQVVAELQKQQSPSTEVTETTKIQEEEQLVDITAPEFKKVPLLVHSDDEDALRRMIGKTSARIGIGHAGLRMKTKTLLAFRADHAAARDTVFFDVSEKLLQEMNLFSIQTKCSDRNQFLTRPDLGREFNRETLDLLKTKCKQGVDVQIYAADGLSSRAIEANLPNILPVLIDGLKAKNISVGTPFFVKYGRVGTQEHITETLGCRVSCVLIGERPGLGSAESMSAYIAYEARVGMPEAHRTVVSNIYSGGTTAVEAGAYLVEVIEKILKQKASGVNLKK